MAEVTAGVEAPTVKSIFVYPIKSCGRISVSQAPLASTGFRWDRLWMVVNSNGRMYTQRVMPKLALVQVHLPPEAFSPGWKPNKTSFLEIRAPGMNVVKVPLVEPRAMANGISVWNWNGSAFDEGDEVAAWFSNYLEKPSRLVRFNEESESRPVMSDLCVGHTIRFSDAYPFHLLSQSSMDALNSQLSEPVPVNRFRPNLLIDGCEPFSEDLWNEVEINGLTFSAGELCWRCKIPTINQDTAIGGSEPNETLKNFRSGRVYVGTFMVCSNDTLETEKDIRVGDPVHVLKTFSSYAECPV
ncbi:molybdenum cofactor sulfurase family protein [Striga asiatica]|uniref:Molybdenum cofactor sulfurase family protein n=1 Tax=Striga asiatica TaxID=4170 RepID=A0A5A7PJM4_STRAF|nr:molybdenum cofactor sulfurase family protein [Striga asiatica]